MAIEQYWTYPIWWDRSIQKRRALYAHYILVGGFKHDFYFPFHIWDVILNPLTHSIIFQDGPIAPPTSIPLYVWICIMGWMSPEISDLDDTYLDFLMRHVSGGCLKVNPWCSQNSLQVGNPQAGTSILKLDSCQKWVCLWIKYAKMPWTIMDPHGLSSSFQLGGNFGYTYPWCVKVISQI